MSSYPPIFAALLSFFIAACATQPPAYNDDAPFSMGTFADLAARLSPSVVNLRVTRDKAALRAPEQPMSHASGVIIDAEGHILTNHHVVRRATQIDVQLADGTETLAVPVGSYPELDVALLKLQTERPLTPATLGQSDTLKVGEWVLAIGNPFGHSHTVTTGIVSALDRRDVTPRGRANLTRFIQTDASINPGNSGGPLINLRGEVVGINTGINGSAQGISYAIPIDMITHILPGLYANDIPFARFGVNLSPIPREPDTPRRSGAYVHRVHRNTPAALADLRRGDLITHFDGHPISHPEDLLWRARHTPIGTPVRLTLERDGEPLEREYTPTAVPEPRPVFPEALPSVVTEFFQYTPHPDDPHFAEYDPLPATVPALRVVHVSPTQSRPGLSLELNPGDIIFEVNDRPVTAPDDLERAIYAYRTSRILRIFVRRGNTYSAQEYSLGFY